MGEHVTMEVVRLGKLRESGHLNYGKKGGGTIWQHTTIRRLKAIDRPALTDEEQREFGGRGVRVWSVDGGPAGSLDDAIAALNVPAVLTPDEQEVLHHVPADWVRLHDFRLALAKTLGRQVSIDLMMVGDKGFTETDMRPGSQRREPWIRRKLETDHA
ncbi:hypothetical protein JRF84_08155 [Methylobacterium organophilum]|uniref:hypothetical protein n=1 Tax=Methylobacterium TaxID=407 RepID=UPI0019D158F0|nr:hypothetical protein [Methylobacterium organophilum]MBN6819561.1 hypothetical protein [Methylobacterium organophilum]